MQVLDKGFVELIDHMGSDLSAANAARVSLGKRKDAFDAQDAKLLNYLAAHKHESPFRHAYVTLHIKAPIFVLRQWMKHVVGCVSGSTEIHVNKHPSGKNLAGCRTYKIAELYDWWINGRAHKRCKSGKTEFKNRIKKLSVRSYDESSGRFVSNHVKDILHKGVKPVYEVTLSSGKRVTITADHLLLTREGWKPLAACVNSLEDFRYAFYTVATNGISCAGDGRYRDPQFLSECAMSGKTLDVIAEECGCSSETIKKWYYAFEMPFVKRDTRFSKGNVPWNVGKHYKFAQKKWHLTCGYEDITAIAYRGEEDVYDVVMENQDNPNFVANGVIVHNCSFNEISGRYVEFDPEYYVPEVFRSQSASIKQGSDGVLDANGQAKAYSFYLTACSNSFKQYQDMLELGVAKEQARCVLPLGIYSEVYWTASLQAVAHFLHLRQDGHAQWEIQQYAAAVRELVEPLFPVSLNALLANS